MILICIFEDIEGKFSLRMRVEGSKTLIRTVCVQSLYRAQETVSGRNDQYFCKY